MNSDEGSCKEVALQEGEREEGEERNGQLLGIDIGFLLSAFGVNATLFSSRCWCQRIVQLCHSSAQLFWKAAPAKESKYIHAHQGISINVKIKV